MVREPRVYLENVAIEDDYFPAGCDQSPDLVAPHDRILPGLARIVWKRHVGGEQDCGRGGCCRKQRRHKIRSAKSRNVTATRSVARIERPPGGDVLVLEFGSRRGRKLGSTSDQADRLKG